MNPENVESAACSVSCSDFFSFLSPFNRLLLASLRRKISILLLFPCCGGVCLTEEARRQRCGVIENPDALRNDSAPACDGSAALIREAPKREEKQIPPRRLERPKWSHASRRVTAGRLVRHLPRSDGPPCFRLSEDFIHNPGRLRARLTRSCGVGEVAASHSSSCHLGADAASALRFSLMTQSERDGPKLKPRVKNDDVSR